MSKDAVRDRWPAAARPGEFVQYAELAKILEERCRAVPREAIRNG